MIFVVARLGVGIRTALEPFDRTSLPQLFPASSGTIGGRDAGDAGDRRELLLRAFEEAPSPAPASYPLRLGEMPNVIDVVDLHPEIDAADVDQALDEQPRAT